MHSMELMLDDIGSLHRVMCQQREVIGKFGRECKDLTRESTLHPQSDPTCIWLQSNQVAKKASDLTHKIELQAQDFEKLKQAATDMWNKVRTQINHTLGS